MYRFQTKKIKAMKYNSSLDELVQNFRQYECLLRLSDNKDEIIITNLKPDGDNAVIEKVSSSSFLFSEVKGFIFCGMSSRFWMLRKHINSLDMTDKKLKKLPFYNW